MISYLIAMATFASIYAILALALNVMWGMAGMVNLGIVGFYGFGAYISALLTVNAHTPIALGFAAAMAGTAIMGALVTLGLARLRDDYLAIVTLGFAEAVRIVAENEIWLTRGTDGISGIPQPLKHVLGSDFNAVYLVFCLVILALAAGGIGNNFGAVIGAFVVVFFLESTRFLQGVVPWVTAEQFAALREFLVGFGLLLVLYLRPRGLMPEPVPKLVRSSS